jgi:hypothetical protein
MNTGSSATAYAVPGGVPNGQVAANSDFSITNGTINYLAQDSYYWYKVNTVEISFPSYVRCPRYYKNIAIDRTPASGTAAFLTDGVGDISTTADVGLRIAADEYLDDTFRCMDSGNFNGHRGWDSSVPYNHQTSDTYADSQYFGHTSDNHRPTENYPYYIETLTENDGSAYGGILVHHNHDENDDGGTAGDNRLDNEDGFICGDVPPFGSGANDYKGEWYKCGQKYTVHGLMNTYDEYAQLEYGTMQEIWFQFWYHYVITWDTNSKIDQSTYVQDSAVLTTNPVTDGSGTNTSAWWDKRNSNTARRNPYNDASPHHNGDHGDVYFTMSNYKNNYGSDGIMYDHIHNYPNILFNAFELKGIRFFCDKINSFNSNTCFHTGANPEAAYSAATLIGDSMTNP